MAMKQITAYKCEWCGKVMENSIMHEFECRYEPKSRTCTTCGFSGELKYSNDDNLRNVRYCPRADKLFAYPCEKYCSDYKRDPIFEEGKE